MDSQESLNSPIPAHLDKRNAIGLVRNEPVAQFEIGSFKNFVYLVLDWKEHKALVIDPQKNINGLTTTLAENNFKLIGIALTHTHWDHIAGVPGLLELAPHTPIFVHEKDQHRLANSSTQRLNIRPISEGESISVGTLKLEVLHTPGHSAGECCFFLAAPTPYLFTGDTIFIRDCGRTDLESGSNREMFESIQRIKKLPSHTIILPGHHYAPECASTLEKEMAESAPFSAKDLDELAALP